MKICIIGCGFVGLTTGVTFAHLKHQVRLVEIERSRYTLLKVGKAPFKEPGLQKMLEDGIKKGMISISNNASRAASESDFIFIAVQTPVLKSGASKLDFLEKAAHSIGKSLREKSIVIVKSTVPPGTTEDVVVPILERASRLKCGKDFDVAMNPEFLQEGKAIEDSLKPSRIIVGAQRKQTAERVLKLFEKIKSPRLVTDIRTAEMIKLVSNCMLSTKISYSNEIANICERSGIDVNNVMKGVGLDPRIGERFLNAGVGFGGSCLPKDLSALIFVAESKGVEPRLLKAVRDINENQPIKAVDMLEEELGSLEGKRIALLGLAFKAGVDDIRDSRASIIVAELLARGCIVVGYDPTASDSFRVLYPEIKYAKSARDALVGAHGCIIQTEEKEFSMLGRKDFLRMKGRLVIDGRRFISIEKLEKYGINVRAIGLGKDFSD